METLNERLSNTAQYIVPDNLVQAIKTTIVTHLQLRYDSDLNCYMYTTLPDNTGRRSLSQHTHSGHIDIDIRRAIDRCQYFVRQFVAEYATIDVSQVRMLTRIAMPTSMYRSLIKLLAREAMNNYAREFSIRLFFIACGEYIKHLDTAHNDSYSSLYKHLIARHALLHAGFLDIDYEINLRNYSDEGNSLVINLAENTSYNCYIHLRRPRSNDAPRYYWNGYKLTPTPIYVHTDDTDRPGIDGSTFNVQVNQNDFEALRPRLNERLQELQNGNGLNRNSYHHTDSDNSTISIADQMRNYITEVDAYKDGEDYKKHKEEIERVIKKLSADDQSKKRYKCAQCDEIDYGFVFELEHYQHNGFEEIPPEYELITYDKVHSIVSEITGTYQGNRTRRNGFFYPYTFTSPDAAEYYQQYLRREYVMGADPVSDAGKADREYVRYRTHDMGGQEVSEVIQHNNSIIPQDETINAEPLNNNQQLESIRDGIINAASEHYRDSGLSDAATASIWRYLADAQYRNPPLIQRHTHGYTGQD